MDVISETYGVGITGVPLNREVGAFGTIDDGIVSRERAFSDGVSTEAGVGVNTN